MKSLINYDFIDLKACAASIDTIKVPMQISGFSIERTSKLCSNKSFPVLSMIPRSTSATPISSHSRSGLESGGSDTNLNLNSLELSSSDLKIFDNNRLREGLLVLSILNTFLKRDPNLLFGIFMDLGAQFQTFFHLIYLSYP